MLAPIASPQPFRHRVFPASDLQLPHPSEKQSQTIGQFGSRATAAGGLSLSSQTLFARNLFRLAARLRNNF